MDTLVGKEHCGVIRMVKFAVMEIVTLFQSDPFTTEHGQNNKEAYYKCFVQRASNQQREVDRAH